MKITKTPKGIAKSFTAAAKACGLTPRTIRDLKAEGFPGIRTDGTVDLAVFWPAYLKRKTDHGGTVSLKDEKTTEEIRKLRLVNDVKEGTLISRAWMAERIHIAAGKVDGFRHKSESEHPLLFAEAAGDVAACREIVRKIWDEVLGALNGLATDFKEPTNGESRKGSNA
jgi:hypothetical protein